MATAIEKAVWLMKEIADGDYGYSQPHRDGAYGREPSDFDCSSLVTYCWQSAGVPVRDAGASTTSNMYKPFIKCGFKDVSSQIDFATGKGLRMGDVLLHPYDGERGHTEMMLNSTTICGARRDENGKDGWEGSQPGDQTGHEIEYGAYYNFPWTFCLRYEGHDVETDSYSATLESSRDFATWSTGAGVLTRACPYISVPKSALGFEPSVIVCQQEGEILANSQWLKGQPYIYVSNFENDATAGVRVGSAKGDFNPSSVDIQIPVRFPSRKYIVKIYK